MRGDRRRFAARKQPALHEPLRRRCAAVHVVGRGELSRSRPEYETQRRLPSRNSTSRSYPLPSASTAISQWLLKSASGTGIDSGDTCCSAARNPDDGAAASRTSESRCCSRIPRNASEMANCELKAFADPRRHIDVNIRSSASTPDSVFARGRQMLSTKESPSETRGATISRSRARTPSAAQPCARGRPTAAPRQAPAAETRLSASNGARPLAHQPSNTAAARRPPAFASSSPRQCPPGPSSAGARVATASASNGIASFPLQTPFSVVASSFLVPSKASGGVAHRSACPMRARRKTRDKRTSIALARARGSRSSSRRRRRCPARPAQHGLRLDRQMGGRHDNHIGA